MVKNNFISISQDIFPSRTHSMDVVSIQREPHIPGLHKKMPALFPAPKNGCVFILLGFQLQSLDATVQNGFYQCVTSYGLCIANHVNKADSLNQPNLTGKSDLFQPAKCLKHLILQALKSY